MVVLEARNVGKVFAGGEVQVTALAGVALQVHSGEMLAIVGPSGSGKSTLLHLLGGLDSPTSGEVFLEGRELGSLDDEQRSQMRRRRVGFVFQKINLLPTIDAIENAALPLLIDGVPRADAMSRAAAAIALVGMQHRARHFPATLSGGEQQRVAIARALVIDPAVILADEPTGSLDRANGQQIVQLMRSCVENGRTVVVVTHDPEVAAHADRRIEVRDGRIQTAEEPAREPVAVNQQTTQP
jgi:putative ABC transport system ATP-binding protein